MLKRISVLGTSIVALLMLSSVAASSASAAACYRVDKVKSGNFSTGACTVAVEVAKLTGEYVLATLDTNINGYLWCAEAEGATGFFKNAKCTEAETDGKFTEVLVLPDISLTLGGTYPLHLNYASSGETGVATELQNINGGVLHGKGLKVAYSTSELTSLGTFSALFLKVEKGTEKCFNQGAEAAGEVLTEGSFHIVYTSLAGSTSGLQLGILYLVKELSGTTGTNQEIQCPTNSNKIKVKGSVIGTLNLSGTTEASQLTGLKGVLNGVNGKQSFRAFWNDAGTGLLARLLSNIDGAGYLESNQIVAGEPEATTESQMFEITNR